MAGAVSTVRTSEEGSKRGGRRPGAGRKPNYLKRLGIKAITAAEILAYHSEIDLWTGLLTHKNPTIRLQTLQYLTDRRDGRPKQAVEVAGGIIHAHTVYRDPLLAALSPEELKALDNLTRKLALPAPDGPHNQIESKPAIEAESMESGQRKRVESAHMKRQDVLAELVGGVWHTTNQDRFLRILECGAILPEPDISEHERWGTAVGPEGHSYVRSIGGVSLFDFQRFEAESYSAKYPASSWETFVPCLESWDAAVWIEIDHESLGPAFVSGVELLGRRKAEGSSRRIMPLIEGAHIGPLPCRAFKKAFSARREPEDPHSLAAVLKAGRLKPR